MQAATCTSPNAPDGLIATGADGQVTVTWNSVSGVSSYTVYWSTNLSSATALSTMTKIDGIAASPYAHTGRTNNTTYYYRVTSVSGNCESAASSLVNATPSATTATTGGGATTGTGTGTSTVTTAPSAPANVTAAAADGQVTLSWNAVSGATSYKVYLGTATGVTTSNATISTSTASASLTQTGLTNGTAYYFIVTASNSAGESAASSEASATPVAAATAPAAPAGVSATAGDGQVTITWTAVTGATSYTVYYGTSTGVTKANATGNSTSTVASLTKTGLTNGIPYYFIVTATNAVGESAASSEVSATPATPHLPSLGAWSTTSAMTTARRFHGGATYNGYLYAVGGHPLGGSGELSSVEYAKVNADGTVGAWTATSAMTSVRGCLPEVFAYNGYIYAIGGGDCGGNQHLSAEYAAINADGTLGAWTALAAPPLALTAGGVVAVNGYVYLIGGGNPTVTANVYYAPINANGTLGTWNLTSSLSAARSTTAFTYNGYIYAVGGNAGNGAVNLSSVEYAKINANGTLGAWATTTSMNFATRGFVAFAYQGYAYRVAGHDATLNITSTTEYAPINADGTLGAWTYSTNLVAGEYGPAGAVVSGRIYVFGGYQGGGGTNSDSTVQYASIGQPILMGGAVQKALTLTGAVTTFAGSAGVSGTTDATGTSALFNYPASVTIDGTNLYVVDYNSNTVRKIVIATGAVTTLASGFNGPYGITTDGTNLYFADNLGSTIRQVVIATGVATTLAGSAGISGTTDGTGAAARFLFPMGITTDGTNLYVGDAGNNTIRKVVISTGVVTTLAGGAGVAGSTDGTGTAARFNSPSDLVTDGTNLYVADTNNNTVRKVVIGTGAVTTLAGSAGVAGSTDGTGAAARFNNLNGITTDGTNIYVADYTNNTIRKVVISTGVVTTLAGSAGVAGSTDGTGTAARFNLPCDLTTDGTSLYVTDASNRTIRKIQ